MRRLQLAYAWGKWIAIRREEYEQAMAYYKSLRPRSDWGILVHDDEPALLYQRCDFRIKRAMRAVGAWGMIGHASLMEGDGKVSIMGIEFPAKVATADELAKMNHDQFQRNERCRASKAKQISADKRHPLATYEDHCAEEDALAIEAEMRSATYGW